MAVSVKLITILAWSNLLIHQTSSERLLTFVYGDVSRGDFIYYTLTYEGPITLYLRSEVGDADLYISQYLKWPTYELDSYCLHSVTTGLDTVHIPASFKRPVGIGVYGHVSHEVSSYVLEVYFASYYYEHDFYANEDFNLLRNEQNEPELKEEPESSDIKDFEDINNNKDDEDNFGKSFLMRIFYLMLKVLVDVVIV